VTTTGVTEKDIRFLCERCPLDTGVVIDVLCLSENEAADTIAAVDAMHRVAFLLFGDAIDNVSAEYYTMGSVFDRQLYAGVVLDSLQTTLQRQINDAVDGLKSTQFDDGRGVVVRLFADKAGLADGCAQDHTYRLAEEKHLGDSRRLFEILEKVRATFGLVTFEMPCLDMSKADNPSFPGNDTVVYPDEFRR